MMLSMIDDHVRRGDSFAFETTLSGRGYARMIPQWQELGYRVELHFLRLPTPEIAIARVMQRVSEGGHSVPPEVIRRRFHAGWYNFETIYRDLVDHWAVYTTLSGVSTLLEEKGDE
jgi:predicted ABC-type ATPase